MFEGATHHIGVLQQAQYQQPWGLLNCPSSSSIMMSKNMNNMITSCVDLRGSSECVDMNIGSHNNTTIIDAEDFFIGDLSDFSNEDIAAPIKNASLLLMQDGHSSFQFSSDDNSTSASISKGPPSAFNSHSTTTTHTSTSGSVLLHASPTALDNFDSSLHIEMDSSLSLPCQNEAGFEWLMSFGEDNLMYDGASNFGMDSFLLSNAEPFDGGYDGLMKHGGYEEDDSSVKGVKVGLTMNDATTNDVQGRCGGDHFSWHNEDGDVKEFDAIMFMPYSTGSRSARIKRAHSAGWSSSNILCNNWDNDSPTTSLNSTSQFMPNPPYSNPTLILPKQEEKGEEHGYIDPTQAPNKEIIANSTLSPPNRDKPFIKASKFSSSDQLPNSWAKEAENTRKECVSNYGGVQPRRCTHCLSQKTPQWRAGPHGPKTLCNACGVRFKSGRLFDEYRPAKSPTFLSYKHSNSHKKVMEMRRRKTFPYNHRHHHQQQAAHQARAAPRSFKHAEVDSHLGNKLKIKLNPSALEPHSHFSDVTLISTRSAIESPSSFLY